MFLPTPQPSKTPKPKRQPRQKRKRPTTHNVDRRKHNITIICAKECTHYPKRKKLKCATRGKQWCGDGLGGLYQCKNETRAKTEQRTLNPC